MIIFWLVALTAIGFVAYLILDFFFDINNPASRIKKDKQFGAIELKALSKQLVPLTTEEMGLISYEIKSNSKKDMYHTESFGTIESIYSESLIAYYHFVYSDGRELLMTKSSSHQVNFLFNNNQWTIESDQFGKLILEKNYDFLDTSTGNRLAHIDVKVGVDTAFVMFNDQKISHLNWGSDLLANSRVFSQYLAKESKSNHINYCYSIIKIFKLI